MDKNFEKVLIGLMALAFIALPFLNSSAQASEKGEGLIGSYGLINEYPGIMRFHVVANSDSTEDQDLKLQVRLCPVKGAGGDNAADDFFLF